MKLTKWTFLRLFCLSPLRFDQLVNRPDEVSEYLARAARAAALGRRRFNFADFITFKALRAGLQLRLSAEQDAFVLRAVAGAAQDVLQGVQDGRHAARDSVLALFRVLYQNAAGRRGAELRGVLKVQAALIRE